MRDRIDLEQMPRFWPPKPSRFWDIALGPLHRAMLRRSHGIHDITIEGMERIAQIPAADGILLCPNHSYTGDGSVMLEFGRRAPRRMYIMAAWHGFRGHYGIDGFLLQRMGAFSVDREGCDRQAMKQAGEILATGRMLCIFPEGEIYHLNQRLTPLREGVAFIAATAQRELDKAKSDGNVWLVPVAICYSFLGDVTPALNAAMTTLEQRMLITPDLNRPLHERIIRFGEIALTLQEKQHLGAEQDGDLPSRLARLTDHLLAEQETRQFGKTNRDEPTPVRVKLLRQHLMEKLWDEQCDPAQVPALKQSLADVHRALQLYSYPGDYISTQPSVERMAETIEKFEEDVYGTFAKPKGQRRARIKVGEPTNVRQHASAGKLRAVAAAITSELEARMRATMSS
jgi:1-acyl-sn-glycerol-3-phosphate acyltransferase